MAALVHVYSGTCMCKLLQKMLNILDDLALYSDDYDNYIILKIKTEKKEKNYVNHLKC